MTLDELEIGREAVITKVGGEGALRCRFLDMGLIELTIRKEDAGKIEVEPEEN